MRDGGEIGAFWQVVTDSAVDVFNATFLPGSVRIAEVSLASKAMEFLMGRELAAIVERDGFPGVFR